ncbi:hypothetical protein ABZW03_25340 [Kitasatospora sp. NPDC004799]
MDRQPLTRASRPTPPRATEQDLDAPPLGRQRCLLAGVSSWAVTRC